jgi:chemotaxis protein MotB
MKPKYLEPGKRTQDRWMASYVDILTILLVFFIAAALKTQPVTAAAAVPVAHPLATMEKRLAAEGLAVRRDQRGIVISVPQAILFESDDVRFSRSAMPLMKQIAKELAAIPNKVTLVGHTDALPVQKGRFRNNWDLSSQRTLRLLELLMSEFGIEETRLSLASDGPNKPATSNATAEGRAANRRVEIVIATH